MSLLSAIPGLAKHQVIVHQELDREKASRLIGDARSLLKSLYPAGAHEWLESERPDMIRGIKEAETAIDTAILAANEVDFPGALERFVNLHQEAYKIYNERPPVIERQAELFSAVA